jgi:protein-disulfide isomerase
MTMFPLTKIVVSLALLFGAAAALADGMTSEQADEILQELKQIHQLLERQQTAPAPTPAVVPPAPQRVQVQLGKEFSLGRADAPVTVVEFNDLQCPFCARFHATTFPEIKKNYIDTGKVRFINRDLPLDDLHPQAIRAANAARCGGEQNKYWEVAAKIIENSGSLSPQSIDQYAKLAGVDMKKFQSCMESGRNLDAIRESAQAARALGVSGTPSFVIGRVTGDTLDGQIYVGALPYASFDAAIKGALAP